MEPIIMYFDIWESLDINPRCWKFPGRGEEIKLAHREEKDVHRVSSKNGVQAYRSLPSRKEKTEAFQVTHMRDL